MKVVFSLFLLLMFSSCLTTNNNTDKAEQLRQRVSYLEKRIDSLIRDINVNTIELNNINNRNTISSDTLWEDIRCLAITKKGTQCKRRAKHNTYCWQHGG